MAKFSATCPACKKAFDVPADKAGEKVECPECFEVFDAGKPGGKIKVVVTQDPPAKKGAKKKPARKRDDDDDYDHDRRDDDDDGGSRQSQRGYNIRPPGVALTLGILSVLFLCVPVLGLIFSIATIAGPPSSVYHPADQSTVRTGRMLASVTLGLYFVAILAAVGYFSR